MHSLESVDVEKTDGASLTLGLVLTANFFVFFNDSSLRGQLCFVMSIFSEY